MNPNDQSHLVVIPETRQFSARVLSRSNSGSVFGKKTQPSIRAPNLLRSETPTPLDAPNLPLTGKIDRIIPLRTAFRMRNHPVACSPDIETSSTINLYFRDVFGLNMNTIPKASLANRPKWQCSTVAFAPHLGRAKRNRRKTRARQTVLQNKPPQEPYPSISGANKGPPRRFP